MRRREFVAGVGALALAARASGSAPTPPLGSDDRPSRIAGPAGADAANGSGSAPTPRHWAWVHGDAVRRPDEWRRQFARLRAAGLQGVLVSGGDTAALSAAARGEGLAFQRWTWALNRSGDAWVKQHRPQWFTVSREGRSSLEHPPYVGYYQWLCPTRPEVRAYLAGKMTEIARDPAVDGVHLDYVRHCDVILPVALWPKYGLVQDHELAPFDFCYCDACRDAFRARTGRDPAKLGDPSADAEWRRFREEAVTGLVREVAAAVRAAGKPVTAAVFPTPSIARRLVRQAWDEWPLDAVFPMAYHGFYLEPVEWIATATREGLAQVGDRFPLHAGLYLPDLPPDALGRAVRLALGAGAAGVSLFELDGLTDAHLAAFAAALSG